MWVTWHSVARKGNHIREIVLLYREYRRYNHREGKVLLENSKKYQIRSSEA